MEISHGRRRAALGAAALLLLAGCADRAQRDVVIAPNSSSGVVILSLVADVGSSADATYWYRPAAGGGSRAIELSPREPGQTPEAFPLLLDKGEVVVLQLQPGVYVIERLQTRTTRNQRVLTSEARFAVAFEAVAGKVLYAGQLAVAQGILPNDGSLTITNQGARDVPRALQAYAGLRGTPVEVRAMRRTTP